MTATQAKSEKTASSGDQADQIRELIGPIVAALGYEIVHLEVQAQRQKILRVFIDRLAGETAIGAAQAGAGIGAVPTGTAIGAVPTGTAIGIEDCVRVTKALDEPLEKLPEIEAIFKGAYELEVSSPGVDRPLRAATDYQRFSGQEARIHVFRPLTAEELCNAAYQSKNPKQKNFVGLLKGLREDRVVMAVPGSAESGAEISIPLSLISKANLEPKFEDDLSKGHKREREKHERH